MWIITSVIVLAVAATLWLWINKASKYLTGMPSPDGHPILGSLLDLKEMSQNPHILLEKWAKKLGDVYYFRVVRRPIVVVNSQELIQEALVKRGKDFRGRLLTLRNSILAGDMKGGLNDIVLNNPDNSWNLKRKITHRALKQIAQGHVADGDPSIKFIEVLIQKFQSYQGKSFDPRDDVYETIAGMIYSLSLGAEIKAGTDDMKQAVAIERCIAKSVSPSASGLLLDEFPILRFIGNEHYKLTCETRKRSDKFLEKFVTMKKENSSKNAHGVLDDLLQAQTQFGKQIFSEECIFNILRDLTSAGIGTTSPVLCSLLNILVARMDVQKAMHEEITSVLGSHNLPKLKDQEYLPYCRAVIFEALRILAAAPILLPHLTLCDTELKGFNIQKGTLILFNVWAAQHNDKFWVDPYAFKPERFLDEEGKLVPADHPNRKGLMTFGTGARSCLGDTLAINRLFLFVVSLLQTFELLPDPDCKESFTFDVRCLEMILVVMPKEFRIIALSRK